MKKKCWFLNPSFFFFLSGALPVKKINIGLLKVSDVFSFTSNVPNKVVLCPKNTDIFLMSQQTHMLGYSFEVLH